jgi:hypothetical protein
MTSNSTFTLRIPKLPITKFNKQIKSYDLEVTEEPYFENVEMFELTSGDFKKSYKSYKSALNSRNRRGFAEYEINSYFESQLVYNVKIKNNVY